MARSLNLSVREGMNDISDVKIHLKTRSGNVNIFETMGCVDDNNFFVFLVLLLSQRSMSK